MTDPCCCNFNIASVANGHDFECPDCPVHPWIVPVPDDARYCRRHEAARNCEHRVELR